MSSSSPADYTTTGCSLAIASNLRAVKENSLKSSGDSSYILRVSSLNKGKIDYRFIRKRLTIVKFHYIIIIINNVQYDIENNSNYLGTFISCTSVS